MNSLRSAVLVNGFFSHSSINFMGSLQKVTNSYQGRNDSRRGQSSSSLRFACAQISSRAALQASITGPPGNTVQHRRAIYPPSSILSNGSHHRPKRWDRTLNCGRGPRGKRLEWSRRTLLRPDTQNRFALGAYPKRPSFDGERNVRFGQLTRTSSRCHASDTESELAPLAAQLCTQFTESR